MDQRHSDEAPQPASSPTNRRDFLQQAAGIAAGIAALSPAAQADDPHRTSATRLPTIRLGPHEVTRLILGGNPIYGYSHFNRHFDRHLIAWHTPERVLELLKRCEECGLNTFQNSYAERTLADVDRYRASGGSMHWLCLGKPDWDRYPEHIADAARHKPIGIAPHGALNERLHRQKKYDVLTDLLKRIRDQGVLVGLSAHDPTLIEEAEHRGWDVDYFMCSLYYLTRPKEEYKQILGAELPLGEIYLPSDPLRMFRAIQATKKPCLAYKVLAAGRRVGSPAEVRRCFEEAFANIKPTDAVIVGMYQQFGDQVAEDAALVREIGTRSG
ncbi:MAG: twin-arginine translocation signal domain-containing protein [Isosphaeraceae bacterium]|nr:twin-arginine translocation signal domain-containing protein [Isosphaeraceae bacterium]